MDSLNKTLDSTQYFDILEKVAKLEDGNTIGSSLDSLYEECHKFNPNYVEYLYQHATAVQDQDSFSTEPMIVDGDFTIRKGDIALGERFTPIHYALLWCQFKFMDRLEEVLNSESDNPIAAMQLLDKEDNRLMKDYLSEESMQRLDRKRAKRIADSCYQKIKNVSFDYMKALDFAGKGLGLILAMDKLKDL
ncbi:hypothetical protein V6R21_18890 [Limibacter armeniacum]|uniref:hypothetical protein n=1 Tax=Limibacter armeniacum TaxID=466084 RepID=UPI002FE51A5D